MSSYAGRSLLIIMGLLALFAFPASADELDASRAAVEQHFKSDAEPAVLDAVWTDKSVFKVGVRDTGSSRDGYAQYVCMVLIDHGFKGKRILVRVVDYHHLVRTDEWRNLGTAHCQ